MPVYARQLISCALLPPLPCSPSGTFLPDDTAACELCPEDTYRAGDATPENNVCKPVPAGAH